MAEDVELEVDNAKDLLAESLKVLSDKKDAQKGLKDATFTVLEKTNGDKYDWGIVSKVNTYKGCGWVNGNPLTIDPKEPHKDAISGTFNKLAETIAAFTKFDCLDKLQEYFDALEALGITISVDEEQFAKNDMSEVDIDEALRSQSAYRRTIDEYSDELKEVHAVKAEELNFAPKAEYGKLLNIYKRGIAGKDVDDAVQDKITLCEFTETAYNLVKGEIDSTIPDENA